MKDMLIYLNGTSSSGKSSLAHSLQKHLPTPCFYFSIDTLLYSLHKSDLDAIMGKLPYRTKMNWDAIFKGYLAGVSALVTAGNDVIADLPIYTESLGRDFEFFLNAIPNKNIVKVDCPLETLEVRERNRGDRAIGIARRQFSTIHNFLNYNIVVDTSTNQSDELATKILARGLTV